jgi:phosphoglycolate phosphatase-like HAD superfamily hydrolase
MNKEIKKIKLRIDQSKLLIFDFDGVIADSVEVKSEAFAILYESYGVDVVNKIINHHNSNGGMSRFEKFKYYHKNFLNKEISEELINQLSKKFSSLVFNKVVSSDEINSVGKFLNIYSKKEKICVINSATPQLEIEKIINAKGFDQIFSSVFGSPNSKLENIIKILNKYNCSNNEVVFFGDSKADLLAAKRANIDFIGIGSSIREDISIMGLNYSCIKDFREIVNE